MTVSRLQTQLDVLKEKHLKGFTDEIEIYRTVAELVIEVLVSIRKVMEQHQPIPVDKLYELDQKKKSYIVT